jgi:hypothetical protein
MWKLLLLFMAVFFSSCYSTGYLYKDTVHKKAIGRTKNEILRANYYGVPDRTMDDGAGGSILIYETTVLTTTTNGEALGYSEWKGAENKIYNRNGMVSSSVSKTVLDKEFCHLFLDSVNVVYDFKSNYGNIYDTYKCFNKRKTWQLVAVSVIWFPSLIVTVPAALICQSKAKKAGKICK